MITSKAYSIGITGVVLFVLTTIIGTFLHPNYNNYSQFISELYAVEAPNADLIRYLGYIPSGVLFLLFSFFAIKETPKSSLKNAGFIGIGLSYGLGTIICGYFNCDIGCNPEFINPSLSQIIHNLSGFLTYCIVPGSIFLIAIKSRKWENGVPFSNWSYILSLVSFIFVFILNTNLNSPYKGLIQRVIEISILFWIVLCAFYIKKQFNNA
ncbi:DUF998 domain-containing protein [Flavobacterium sp. K5-23]|uniref:DUF998 domain-containing protein n=1 Tax=Flavobacterium sp. K5-23 TaxID=2746225 RepID=UPI002010649E|nr:DUF998 domain-containing protein [Flavobacterium sp. K5-23]UQD57417.1 DUF998 domain-containing protein [Flavobacterium sp. K5-23]